MSGDLDRALAALTIANGAAAMGHRVTVFFTFWGLTVLRRPRRTAARRSLLQAAFCRLLPRGTRRLPLSRLNLAGLGPLLMRRVMRQRNIASVEELLAAAREQGVALVACTTSMEVLGLTREELVDGVGLAGVASYLGEADGAAVNLFV